MNRTAPVHALRKASGRATQRATWAACFLSLFAAAACADEPVRLTADGRLKLTSAFVGKGDELVFATFESPTLFRLMRLKMADRTVEPLHKDANKSEFEPAFSPDGRYCAFAQNHGVLAVQLVIRDRESNKDAIVPPGAGFSGLRSPAFSPDAPRVAFAFADGDRQQIYSVDLQAADRKTLTDSTGINNWPCYSPDGKQIAFSSTRDGNYEIYVMHADGSQVRRLTDSSFQDLRPKFSPDGKRIAFVSGRDGNYEVYAMNADGSEVVRLTQNPERDDYPTWHPDGKRLVIASERSGRHDLYLVDATAAPAGDRAAPRP
jgi:TolB protein